MKIKTATLHYPPPSKLLLATGILLISMVVFSALNFGMAYLIYGIIPSDLVPFLDALPNDRAVEIAKLFQTVSSIGFFILPALLLAWLFSDHVHTYLRTNKEVNISSAALVALTLICAVPLINYLGEMNSKLMPGFLSGLESWMRSYEQKAAHLTESFLKMENPEALVFNLFLIALLPAVGEELFFRGVVQRIFNDWTKNKHWSIWITAFIFSAVHLQFYGFVPRLLLGASLGYFFVWSGSIWLPIIGHFVNNATAVVLTYLYSSGLLQFNPVNVGADDSNLFPVFISAVLITFLVLIIRLIERNNRWMSRTVVSHSGEIVDYEKVLIDYFDKPEEKMEHIPAPVETPKPFIAPGAVATPQPTETPQPLREVPVPAATSVKRRIELPAPDTSAMTMELVNFELADFSDEAQQEMITRMELPFKLGSAGYLSFLNQYGFIKLDEYVGTPRPTGLGLLMLGKSPQLHFPQARIKFTIHRDNENPVIRDFEGALVLMPGRIEEYLDVIVSSSINREQFHRVVLSEIPKKVLREVIINAIVHRDYSLEGARIMVDAFDDRVEVSSPGTPKFPMKKFYECTVPSVSRNQKISYIFNQMHLVEERGLGMKELKSLKDTGNPPDFKLDNDIFTTIIYRVKKATPVKPEVTPNLTEDAVKQYIKQKERISAGDYSKRFNVTTKTAQRHLHKLIEEGVIEKEGDKKGTKYFLKDVNQDAAI